MPHKHTRKSGKDGEAFNLGPTALARPLPAFKKAKIDGDGKPQSKDKRRKKTSKNIAGYGTDDTPKAFARMMQLQTTKRARSGLDDGDRPPAKKKAKITVVDESQAPSEAVSDIQRPKILPGERLADFSARVNQAIPVAGLARRGKVKIDGVKEGRTRKEKNLHKMYAEWREEDAKIKTREEELAEKAEEEQEEMLAKYGGEKTLLPMGKRTKRQRAIGETGQMDDDPWAVLKKKRQEPRGLHDVAQAPPDLKVIPKEKFKVRNGAKVSVANVPTSAGSLKKREELGEARREVIERYRAMMRANK